MDVRSYSPSIALKRAEAFFNARTRAVLTAAQLLARKWPLRDFVKAAWPLIEPSTPLVWNFHLDAMCDHLQALLEGKLGKQNLLILVPPGSAKSTVVSVCAPAWMWIRQPSWRATFVSGTPSVSVRDSLKTRAIVDSAWYRREFGITWDLAGDANQKLHFENTATGFRQALSTGSRITGARPHALFVDDALDAAEAFSKAARDAVNLSWDQAIANRLSDLQTGTRCVIQQRLHPEDLAGHILATEPENWEVLCIPQLHEEARRTVTSLGWTDPRTTDGELMFPARFPQSVVNVERVRLGQSGFAGQHQQRPTIAEGELFKRASLKLIDGGSLPKFTQVVLSLDTAYSTKETADYSVAVVAAQCDFGIVILDVIRGRYAYPQLRALTEQLAARWHPAAVLVEDKASGQSLVQSLQQETALPVRPVDVDGDKLVRANTVVPAWEAGRIHLLKDAPWLSDFLEELHSFPKSPHDDQVDAFVQAVRYLTAGPGHGFLEYYASMLAAEKETAKVAPRNPWAAPTPSMQERVKREGAVARDAISPWHTP
jgi:predicted phage terminase large subunit-like protein